MTSTQITPYALAAIITDLETPLLTSIHSIIRHPRSLSRAQATWRPPSTQVPLIRADGRRQIQRMSLSITRHRVGPRTRAHVLNHTSGREPSYLLSLRVTDPTGAGVIPEQAEAWVRAIAGANQAGTIHELIVNHALTYVWLVDTSFTPVPSPASLFDTQHRAA